MTDAQEKKLTDVGIILERMFSLDLEAEDDSIVRVMKSRENINLIDLDEGHPAENSGEIVLEKRYCEEHGLRTGDSITISGLVFTIVGIGSTPDYDMPVRTFSDMAVESSRFGTGFVTEKQYEEIQETMLSGAEDYCYAYRLIDSGMTESEVKEMVREFGFDHALTSFVKKADNPRILAAAGDMQINREAGLFAGVIVMVLFTYVISVFAIHQIQQESSVIGTLYALGAKRGDLLLHYITLPTILVFIGGVAGALLGFNKAGIPTQMSDSYRYYSIPTLDVRYSVYLIVYSIVMPPVVSAIVNYLVINRRLSRTALSLIRNGQSVREPLHTEESHGKRFFSRIVCAAAGGTTGSVRQSSKSPKLHFIRLFQLRQMMRERRAGLTVVCGMIIALLVLMLGLNCYVLCRNVQKDSINSTKFEYMYSLKYPEKDIPEGGEACYAETLSRTSMGYTINVSVIGIRKDNPYYDTEPVKGKNNIIISKSVQQKYGLHTGDQLILTDSAEDKDYTFTVEGICSYAGGLAVFMDIDSMRELFGREKDFYNLLLSDYELTIDEGRIYNITTKEDIARSASIFTSLMMGLIIMMTVSAVFKMIMDALYPWMIANAAVGMNLEFPWYLYVEIFAGVMAVYFAVNALLVRKLNRITSAEVLKNRE